MVAFGQPGVLRLCGASYVNGTRSVARGFVGKPLCPVERTKGSIPDGPIVRENVPSNPAITQLPSCELRAGAVKARRPRFATRAGGAKRRALDGAEHSSKIDRVMAALLREQMDPSVRAAAV